jgi:endonuclease/exonuclease/phosphatase family metal-dependent hydrolase
MAALRIATFNLESLDDRPGATPPFAARVAALRPMLERLAADVLCVQEVHARHDADKHAPRRLAALETLIETTRYAGYHLVTSRARDGHGPLDVHNLAILSRLPVAWHRQYWHDMVKPLSWRFLTADQPAEAEVTWERPVLHAAVEAAPGRLLHVFNLHLRAPLAAAVPGQKESAFIWRTTAGWAEGFFLATLKRVGQALEARLAIDALFDAEPEPLLVVCGDMNAELAEMPLRILRADPDDTGAPALAARALAPLERTVPETRRYTVLHGGRAAMLDHVLVSPALFARYRALEVHNERLGDEASPEAHTHPSPGSYHAPIVATFELAG